MPYRVVKFDISPAGSPVQQDAGAIVNEWLATNQNITVQKMTVSWRNSQRQAYPSLNLWFRGDGARHYATQFSAINGQELESAISAFFAENPGFTIVEVASLRPMENPLTRPTVLVVYIAAPDAIRLAKPFVTTSYVPTANVPVGQFGTFVHQTSPTLYPPVTAMNLGNATWIRGTGGVLFRNVNGCPNTAQSTTMIGGIGVCCEASAAIPTNALEFYQDCGCNGAPFNFSGGGGGGSIVVTPPQTTQTSSTTITYPTGMTFTTTTGTTTSTTSTSTTSTTTTTTSTTSSTTSSTSTSSTTSSTSTSSTTSSTSTSSTTTEAPATIHQFAVNSGITTPSPLTLPSPAYFSGATDVNDASYNNIGDAQPPFGSGMPFFDASDFVQKSTGDYWGLSSAGMVLASTSSFRADAGSTCRSVNYGPSSYIKTLEAYFYIDSSPEYFIDFSGIRVLGINSGPRIQIEYDYNTGQSFIIDNPQRGVTHYSGGISPPAEFKVTLDIQRTTIDSGLITYTLLKNGVAQAITNNGEEAFLITTGTDFAIQFFLGMTAFASIPPTKLIGIKDLIWTYEPL